MRSRSQWERTVELTIAVGEWILAPITVKPATLAPGAYRDEKL